MDEDFRKNKKLIPRNSENQLSKSSRERELNP